MNPTFHYLMTKYAALHGAGQGETEDAARLLAEAMEYAPPEFLEQANEMAREMGLIPEKPDGYDEDGEPLYVLENLAARLGIDAAAVPEHIKARAYTGPVYGVQ